MEAARVGSSVETSSYDSSRVAALGEVTDGSLSVASWDLRLRVILSKSALTRATCPSMMCIRLGPRIRNPSRRAINSSVPKPTRLPFNQSLVVVGDDDRLFFLGFHGRLEAADPLADSLAQFGQFFGAENEESDSENYQQVHGLKQSFKH